MHPVSTGRVPQDGQLRGALKSAKGRQDSRVGSVPHGWLVWALRGLSDIGDAAQTGWPNSWPLVKYFKLGLQMMGNKPPIGYL